MKSKKVRLKWSVEVRCWYIHVDMVNVEELSFKKWRKISAMVDELNKLNPRGTM